VRGKTTLPNANAGKKSEKKRRAVTSGRVVEKSGKQIYGSRKEEVGVRGDSDVRGKV